VSRDDAPEPAEIDVLARAWTAADAADAFDAGLDASSAAADPERIWRAAAGESSAEEIRALAREASKDPGVSLAWRLARELGAGAEAVDAPRGTEASVTSIDRSRLGRRLWRPWPIAAAIAAAVLVVVGLRLLGPFGPEPVWRGGDPSAGSQTIVPASEDGALRPRSAFTLHWLGAGEPATRYTVRVTTSDLELLYEALDLESLHATVPEAALAPWPAGTTFYWQVEARSPDGRRTSSPAVRVVLAD
jgi:hypothetical protein